jgi:hypothetical protein
MIKGKEEDIMRLLTLVPPRPQLLPFQDVLISLFPLLYKGTPSQLVLLQ